MISIIIPVYNAEDYLNNCLDSILNQSYTNFEIICVDDGSTDKSLSILKEYNDSRIKIITQENKGPGEARNKAIDIATGNYITFVDADDLLPNDALMNYYEFIKDNKYNVVIGNYEAIYDDSKELVEPHTIIPDFQRFFRSLSVWGKIYKKEFIDNIRFENISQGEDRLFLTDLYIKKPIFIAIDKNVYTWIRHENSHNPTLTHKFNKKAFDEQLYSILKMKDKFNTVDINRTDYLFLNDHLVRSVEYYYKQLDSTTIDLIDMNKFYDLVQSIDWTKYNDFFISIFEFSLNDFNDINSFIEQIKRVIK